MARPGTGAAACLWQTISTGPAHLTSNGPWAFGPAGAVHVKAACPHNYLMTRVHRGTMAHNNKKLQQLLQQKRGYGPSSSAHYWLVGADKGVHGRRTRGVSGKQSE